MSSEAGCRSTQGGDQRCSRGAGSDRRIPAARRAMAYEGMDCPEVTHVARLTHIRSRPWLEQMIARAVRVDPHAGDYVHQKATVYHPDDLLFRRFKHAIE